jgi:hypothetical protein
MRLVSLDDYYLEVAGKAANREAVGVLGTQQGRLLAFAFDE